MFLMQPKSGIYFLQYKSELWENRFSSCQMKSFQYLNMSWDQLERNGKLMFTALDHSLNNYM